MAPIDRYPQAVLFDLLTALLDSWSSWNRAAGDAESGRRWRAEYLRLTYGCGRYLPYEDLVRSAAHATGLNEAAAERLEADWASLASWSGAREVLAAIAPFCKLGIVTNCSARLGHQAAGLLGVAWDTVVTAEEAGYYKPDPRPYRMALERLGVAPHQSAFVAGSGFDLFGTSKVGLRTYWHNRIGLALPAGAPEAEVMSPTLERLPSWLRSFAQPIEPTS